MKLKEFVRKCSKPAEITVSLSKYEYGYGYERCETLFTIYNDNTAYGCINKRFINAEVTSVSATGENKFSVTIQPD